MIFLKNYHVNTCIFEKSTMRSRFFGNTHKRVGVFTPTATVETSILCLFQRSQSPLSESESLLRILKKSDFFQYCHGRQFFAAINTRFIAYVVSPCNRGALITRMGFNIILSVLKLMLLLIMTFMLIQMINSSKNLY